MNEGEKIINKKREEEMGEEMDDMAGGGNSCQLNSEQDIPVDVVSSKKTSTKSAKMALIIMVYINLLNYMDRYTVSSVLSDIQKWFEIDAKGAGLLQTVFVCAYMVFAPIFGYLGDRYPRKYVMSIGITIWSITTFFGSLMKRSQYVGFIVLRALVGIGEASYSTVAPTIIADYFVGDQRTKALTAFYFAIPCGSGAGYIVGSKFAAFMNSWQWALRLTPILGIIAVILTLIFVQEPQRGGLESVDSPDGIDVKPQTYFEDIKQILRVRSFVWSTLGFTAVAFAIGALSWWAPSFCLYAQQVHDKNKQRSVGQVSYIFGIVTFVAGVIGVLTGAEWARRWRVTNKKADAFVCGIGIMVAAPCLFLALWTADKYIIPSWIIMCVGEIFMFFNWTPNADILLYVIPPNCRSTAEAIQILIMHIFGDAFSPFLIGAISDAYTGTSREVEVLHLGLLYSLYITIAVVCMGAVCYFINACYLSKDKITVDSKTKRVTKEVPPSENTIESGGIVNQYYTDENL